LPRPGEPVGDHHDRPLGPGPRMTVTGVVPTDAASVDLQPLHAGLQQPQTEAKDRGHRDRGDGSVGITAPDLLFCARPSLISQPAQRNRRLWPLHRMVYRRRNRPEPNDMFTVTLITNPAMFSNPRWCATCANAMGGGDASGSTPNCAAEFDEPKLPKKLDAVWDSLQAEGVDLIAQPGANRRKKPASGGHGFDHDPAGMHRRTGRGSGRRGEGRRDHEARAMNGELDFEAR
jgi:hypothetical protein